MTKSQPIALGLLCSDQKTLTAEHMGDLFHVLDTAANLLIKRGYKQLGFDLYMVLRSLAEVARGHGPETLSEESGATAMADTLYAFYQDAAGSPVLHTRSISHPYDYIRASGAIMQTALLTLYTEKRERGPLYPGPALGAENNWADRYGALYDLSGSVTAEQARGRYLSVARDENIFLHALSHTGQNLSASALKTTWQHDAVSLLYNRSDDGGFVRKSARV